VVTTTADSGAGSLRAAITQANAGNCTGNTVTFAIPTATDSSCVAGTPSAPCTTGGFIDSHFSCVYLTTCFVSTFFDHYVATDQGLIFREWKNASTDRGGNHGDIANT
jgi:hypothetical protein